MTEEQLIEFLRSKLDLVLETKNDYWDNRQLHVRLRLKTMDGDYEVIASDYIPFPRESA